MLSLRAKVEPPVRQCIIKSHKTISSNLSPSLPAPCFQSRSAISRFPLRNDTRHPRHSLHVHPRHLQAIVSRSRGFTLAAEVCAGVQWLRCLAFTFAPWSRSNRETSRCPSHDDECSGVHPHLSRESTSAPCSMCTESTFPLAAALSNGVWLLALQALISTP